MISQVVALHSTLAGLLSLRSSLRAPGAAGTYEPFSQFDRTSGPPPFGTASTQSYTLVDVSAGGTVTFGGPSVTLSAGVKNLFDVAYRSFLDTYKGYALSPGRNVFVKLSVPFGTSL